jgi:CubicO group peptidase (beta-lactamase class C family)
MARSAAPQPVTVTARAALDGALWQRRLSELCARYEIPGAALGIMQVSADADDGVLAHHGVLNTASGARVTDQSLFAIGSITKVWTATQIMQLTEQGLLDLDAPLADVLPELRLPIAGATERVTMRHLLSHAGGFEADVFTDTGPGDDCLERYVAGLTAGPLWQCPEGTFSYSNAGFSVAGRVIERLTGTTWDAALRDQLITPLRLSRTVARPEQASGFDTAIGHETDADGRPRPVTQAGPPRAAGPAGAIMASVTDVLSFARLHLTGGLAVGGARLLSRAAATAMTGQEAALPASYRPNDSWGLGWARYDWGGYRLIGHDGGICGQSAYLRLLPSHGIAVALLTNGGHHRDLYEDLNGEIFRSLAGIEMTSPVMPSAPFPAVDLTRPTGTYEGAGVRLEVFAVGDALRMRQFAHGPTAAANPGRPLERRLHPVSDTVFAYRAPGARTWSTMEFLDCASAGGCMHTMLRALGRIS